MNKQNLISLLRSSDTLGGGRTAFCAEDQEIAAYVAGALEDDHRQTLKQHSGVCGICAGRLGLLTQLLRDVDESERPPDMVLARARQLGQKRGKWVVPQWAAAAMIVVAIFAIPNWAPNINEEFDADTRNTRHLPSEVQIPHILYPESGLALDASNLTFRWAEVPGTLNYNVRIVTNAGALVTERRIDGTEWRLPDDINLQPGAVYFVRVDAFLADDKAVSSEHVPFRIAE
jgi:hypothetical protein